MVTEYCTVYHVLLNAAKQQFSLFLVYRIEQHLLPELQHLTRPFIPMDYAMTGTGH